MHGGYFGFGGTGEACDGSLRFAPSALRHPSRCLRARRARCCLRALRSQRAGYVATLWAFRLGHICWVGICFYEDGGSVFWDNALSTLAFIGIFVFGQIVLILYGTCTWEVLWKVPGEMCQTEGISLTIWNFQTFGMCNTLATTNTSDLSLGLIILTTNFCVQAAVANGCFPACGHGYSCCSRLWISGSSAYLWEAPIPHSRTLILVQPHLIMEISETNGSLLRNNDSVIISNPMNHHRSHTCIYRLSF